MLTIWNQWLYKAVYRFNSINSVLKHIIAMTTIREKSVGLKDADYYTKVGKEVEKCAMI